MVDHIAKCSQRRDWGKAAPRRCWRRAKSQGRADASFLAPWQGQRRARTSALAAPAHRSMQLHSNAGRRPPRDIEGRRLRAGFILGNGLGFRGEGPPPRKRPPNPSRHGPSSRGLLLAASFLTRVGPGPGQKLVDPPHGPAVDELGEDVSQIGLRIEALDFCCLCRLLDYAEPVRFSFGFIVISM